MKINIVALRQTISTLMRLPHASSTIYQCQLQLSSVVAYFLGLIRSISRVLLKNFDDHFILLFSIHVRHILLLFGSLLTFFDLMYRFTHFLTKSFDVLVSQAATEKVIRLLLDTYIYTRLCMNSRRLYSMCITCVPCFETSK